MCFNEDKCKLMHIGDNNPNFKYYLQGHELSQVKQGKDIGVIINEPLIMNDQCTECT